MSDEPNMVTNTIKTKRPLTDSELLHALKDSMYPIFEHFEEKLVEEDGQQLDIQIVAHGGKIKLAYGVGKPIENDEV